MIRVRLIVDCRTGQSGNAGLVSALFKEYGIDATEPEPQVLVAMGYGLDARTIIFGLFNQLGQLVLDGQITSFKLTREEQPQPQPQPEPECPEGYHWNGRQCLQWDNLIRPTTYEREA